MNLKIVYMFIILKKRSQRERERQTVRESERRVLVGDRLQISTDKDGKGDVAPVGGV